MDINKIKNDFVFQSKTKIMDENSILKGILAKHLLLEFNYGIVEIFKGKINLIWLNDDDSIKEIEELSPQHFGIILPTKYHFLQIIGPVELQVNFYLDKK